MKNILCKWILFCALFALNVYAEENVQLAVQAAPVEAEAYVPASASGIIMYEQAKNKSAPVGLLEAGGRVTMTGEELNGYVRVQGGGVIGWVDKQLLRKAGSESANTIAVHKAIYKISRPIEAVSKPMLKQEIVSSGAADGRVVLYSASWCPYCDKARAYMQRNGVAFDEHDTEKSAKGRRDYETMNGDGIPIILVSNHKIVGWKQAEFERHYGRSQAPSEPQQPAPVVQVARAVAPPARIISSDAGPAYVPKIASGVIVYSQPTNKSTVGGLIKGSQQVIALGEEQNGYMRVQGTTSDGWVDKSLMKKL